MKKRLFLVITCLLFLFFSGFSRSQPVKSTLGWMVGQNGTIIRWNGSTWNSISSKTSTHLNGVFFYRSYYGFAVGNSGTIQRWNGEEWENVTSPTSDSLTDVHLFSSSDGWAVGLNGTIMEWNGSTWDDGYSDVSFGNLRSIDFTTTQDGWAVGDTGKIIRWDGSSWSNFPNSIIENLYSVDLVNSNFGVCVGANDSIYHWNGSNWNKVSSPTSGIDLRSVYMISSSEGWAVGESGKIIRWNGSSWSEYSHSLTTNQLNTVGFNNRVGHDGWIGGNGGVILRYDGEDWSKLSSTPTSEDLNSSFIITEAIDPHSQDRYEADTSDCARCHRSHTGAGKHLVLQPYTYEQCFTCHDGTTSFYDSQTEFNKTYSHTIQGLNDDSTKNCASCHESHRQDIWTEEYLINPLDAKDIWQIVETTSPNYDDTTSPSGIYIWCEQCHTDSSITGDYFEETMSATYKPYTVQVVWQTPRSSTATPPGVDESGTTTGFWQYFRANTYNDSSAGDMHGRAAGSSGTVTYYQGYSNNFPALACTDCHAKHGSDQPWMIDTAFDLSTVSGQSNFCTSNCHNIGSHSDPNAPNYKCTGCHRHGLRF